MKKAHVTKKTSKVTFQVDSDWRPSKVTSTSLDDYLIALCNTATKLKPSQSFPVPVLELKKRYGWTKPDSMSNSIRYILKKIVPKTIFAKLTIHMIKDNANVINFIRIRRRDENI